MDKQRTTSEIPPNAAPLASVQAVKKRIEALGIDYHEGVKLAGVSRNTGYTLLRGRGSLGKLREIEDWLVREEAKRPRPKPASKDERLTEWSDLGAELARLDPARMDEMLEGLREIVKAKKMETNAILKIFRATPEPDR